MFWSTVGGLRLFVHEMEKKQKGKQKGVLPKNIEQKKTRVTVKTDRPIDTETFESADAFASLGFDNSFDFEEFKENFKIRIISNTESEIVFDLIGVDAAIANALRRILLAEIPTMAIEKVYIEDNTSIIQDEVLAHRLGLIPLAVDPRLFAFRGQDSNNFTDKDTIVFELDVQCTHNPGAPADAQPADKYINSAVYSRDLKWKPEGNQAEEFKDKPIKPVHDDILIAKLRPNQHIKVTLHAMKGIGKDHAKWSPVATAFYRLLPEILITEPIKGQEAQDLVKLCPMKVFDIEDFGKEKRAKVSRPRQCTMCRECIRETPWKDRVKIQRVKNHFIFSVESVGTLPAATLVSEALKILLDKISGLQRELISEVPDISSFGKKGKKKNENNNSAEDGMDY